MSFLLLCSNVRKIVIEEAVPVVKTQLANGIKFETQRDAGKKEKNINKKGKQSVITEFWANLR